MTSIVVFPVYKLTFVQNIIKVYVLLNGEDRWCNISIDSLRDKWGTDLTPFQIYLHNIKFIIEHIKSHVSSRKPATSGVFEGEYLINRF